MSNTFEQLLNLQTTLFEGGKRAEILGLPIGDFTEGKNKKCYVYRNEACEPILSLAGKFFERIGQTVNYEYGDYDDSLQAFDQREKDIAIIFYNLDRVDMDATSFVSWISARLISISSLARRTLFIYYSQNGRDKMIAKAMADLKELTCLNLNEVILAGTDIFDSKREKLTGTVLNSRHHVEISKYIGGKFLPYAMNIQFKCIVTDLDNTLYRGILGEDGVDGVELKPMHKYHQLLKKFKQQGVFLAISSKNDESLVREFFEKRGNEIGLSIDDFTAISIGWMPKSTGIKAIASELRVAEDSLVFVDDNHSEIVEVLINTNLKYFVQMRENVDVSVEALDFFPGALKQKSSSEDLIRHKDLLANAEREKLLKENEEDYYRQLEMVVEIKEKDINLERFVELSNKTNQFNLGFKRYTLSDVKKMTEDKRNHLYTFSLRDKLSDSGIVGMLAMELSGKVCTIKELCVSCRALGRKLEDVFVFEAIIEDYPEIQEFIFEYLYQDRNQPIYNWLSRFTSFDQKQDGMSLLKVEIDKVRKEYFQPQIVIKRG